MIIKNTKLKDVKIIIPEPNSDQRGFFQRLFCKRVFKKKRFRKKHCTN